MKRTCDNCMAWGTPIRARSPSGQIRKIVCHFNPVPVTNDPDYWCRQHSENTGWDWQEKEKMPLQRCKQRASNFRDQALKDAKAIQQLLHAESYRTAWQKTKRPAASALEIAEELQERCESFEPLDMI